MGKQSARLIYQGKDHKDIYFQGHYHDAMYLSDSEGKVTLVWEKLKGQLIPYVSMVSYVGGKYYLIAESSEQTKDLGYPVLYEGVSLSKMKKRGLIFGDNPVRGDYYVMHAYSDRLVIIRTYNISDRNVAIIPIADGSADMNNITYELDTYEYSGYSQGTNVSEYVYKKENYYYCKYFDGRMRFYKNDIELPCNTSLLDIWINNNRLIGIGGLSNNLSDAIIPTFRFGILDDNNDTIELKELSLESIVTDLQDSERSGTLEKFESRYNDYRLISETVETVTATYGGGDKFNGFFRASDNIGYVTVSIAMKIQFKGMYKRGTYYFSTTDYENYGVTYRIAVNFYNLSIKSFLKHTVTYLHDVYIYSQIVTAETNVQTVNANGLKTINWQDISDDYEYENYVHTYKGNYIPDRESVRIASAAEHGNELIVAQATTYIKTANFFVIDKENKTAFYKTLEAYEE